MLWEGKFLFSVCSLLIAAALTLLLVYWSYVPTIILVLAGLIGLASIPLVFFGIVRFIRGWKAPKSMLMVIGTFLFAIALIAAIAGGALIYVAKTTQTAETQQLPSNPKEITKTVVVHEPATADEIAQVTAPILAERDAAKTAVARLQDQNNALTARLADVLHPDQFRPFPPPPILRRKLTHKEAEDLIERLGEITILARTAANVTVQGAVLPRGIPDPHHAPEILLTLQQDDGISQALASLKVSQSAVAEFLKDLDAKINANANYADDLRGRFERG